MFINKIKKALPEGNEPKINSFLRIDFHYLYKSISRNLHPNDKLALKIIVYEFKLHAYAKVEFSLDSIRVSFDFKKYLEFEDCNELVKGIIYKPLKNLIK